MKPVRFAKRLIGGLSKNANINDVQPMDFLDGYDIVDKSTKVANEDNLLQPAPNNVLAYDLGTVEATPKVYRVTMDLTELASCNILFLVTMNGIFYNYEITAVPYTSGTDAATFYVELKTWFAGVTDYEDTEFTLVSDNGDLLVFDILIRFYGYSDYFLAVENSLEDVYDCVPLVDAVSVEKVGILRPLEIANINNDGQIFATTNNKKPETLTATAAFTSGLFLTFSTNPDIADGEEVYIYSQIGGTGQFSGLCTLTETFTPNEYYVVGTSNITLSPTGKYTVIKNYRTLSTIGYAQKNEILNTWTYTELLRSNKLNFRTYRQIDSSLDVNSDGLIYDWTDYLNKLKRLIYINGSYGIAQWGFLTVYNSDALYNLDFLETESNLQLGANTSKVTLAVATVTGAGGRTGYSIGSKPEACYAVFVRFKTADGAYSTYSKASNVLWLHSSSVFGHSYGANSGRAIQITIEQIEAELFEYISVGIIEFTTSSWKGYSLPEIKINGQETIVVSDSGFNSESYLSFNDAGVLLEQIPFVFENAKSLISYIGYKVAANVNLFQEYDLTEWAKTIELTVALEKVLIGTETIVDNIYNTAFRMTKGMNDYARCTNEWTSYMPYDKYRFCVFIDWVNGTPTSTYWIDDVSFDPDDTGFDPNTIDYDSVGDESKYNQLIIKATKIQLDYILPDGKYLKEVVKDIRFGRALCNPQVYTTGFGLSVYDDGGGNDYVSGFNDGANTKLDTKLALYSPDFQNTNTTFSFEPSDTLKLMCTYGYGGTVSPDSNLMYLFTGAFYNAVDTAVIAELENITAQSDNNIALYKYSNSGTIYIRNSAAVTTTPFTIDVAQAWNQIFFYLKPYGDNPYPEDPSQTRFFVIPQDKWYDKATHDSKTVYKLYGGDAFINTNAYKIAENSGSTTVNNAVAEFYCYSRTNTALRSGRYPYYTLQDYLSSPYLVDATFEGDRYTYDDCFTPRYTFQNQVAFNPNIKQYLKKFSSIYYSNKGFGSDNAGGNRSWLPLDGKDLETQYGSITHIDVLFGLNSENILMVWQERRFTAQYFNNTANIKSNSGELLIGNGEILGRQGQDLSEFGCELKQTIVKGKSLTGKDIVYWTSFRKGAIMRFGADGTSNIVMDISSLINNETVMALLNYSSPEDEPAFFRGCHAVWDNQRMEYILTIRLYPKIIDYNVNAQIGEFKASPTLTWGFEQFPVIYESLINNNSDVPPTINWKTISGYDSQYFEVLTIVWNERDNKFKSFRTYNPKIYGKFNNTFVSSHPVENNLIYEHNTKENQALYYGVKTTSGITATTDPTLYRITGTAIQNLFPSPFSVEDRSKYVVTIQGKNYEVIDTGTNYLQMASVDDDDILPQVTINNFSFSLYNCQDPYIVGVANGGGGRYFHFGQKSTQADSSLKRTEYEAGNDSIGTTITTSFTNKEEEEYYNGRQEVQIKQAGTLSNTTGLNNVEGIWMKFKLIWRWGKKNRLYDIFIEALTTQKTK